MTTNPRWTKPGRDGEAGASYAGAMPAVPPGPSAVEATDLVLAYGAHVAVRSMSFTIPAGHTTAIIGPNGSGKTTLLRAISGLQPIRSGRLIVHGHSAGERCADVAHVMQANKVNDTVPLTVREVVRMGRYPRRGPFRRFDREDEQAVEEALERLEITGLVGRHLRELSGGQRQRVFVAQGLAQHAEVLLLDEPVTGLDLPSQERIRRVVEEEREAGRSVVLTTHDVATAASADLVLLVATHLVAFGTPDEVLTQEHLGHAYGGTAFRTADGTLVIGDPHIHGTQLSGHHDH